MLFTSGFRRGLDYYSSINNEQMQPHARRSSSKQLIRRHTYSTIRLADVLANDNHNSAKKFQNAGSDHVSIIPPHTDQVIKVRSARFLDADNRRGSLAYDGYFATSGKRHHSLQRSLTLKKCSRWSSQNSAYELAYNESTVDKDSY